MAETAVDTATREALRAYVEYFRDLGVYDFYRRGEPVESLEEEIVEPEISPVITKPAVMEEHAPPAVMEEEAAPAVFTQ